MGETRAVWPSVPAYLATARPTEPVWLFAPQVLQATARHYLEGFAGLVSYAVKANPDEAVLNNLAAAGVRAFDVASPAEIRLLRRLLPGAALHYNNPVRSREELAFAARRGVRSFAVDCTEELDRLAATVPPGACEVSVRFKLPVSGAAYDFGSKFGAPPEAAARLLRRAGAAGFRPSLTFHPGTQCTEPQAWTAHVAEAARIAARAGVKLHRLNVGGGFPVPRGGAGTPCPGDVFSAVAAAVARHFGPDAPGLVCEPGRGLVAESFVLLVRVRARRGADELFLNDGIYGGLAEWRDIGPSARLVALDRAGRPRQGGRLRRCTLFGPTCDSIDRLPGRYPLPDSVQEGDYLVFPDQGAYSRVLATRFNGYGPRRVETVARFGL